MSTFTHDHFLTGFYHSAADVSSAMRSAKALAFGHLVQLTQEAGIEHYHSDLFHDALWLHEHVQEEVAEGDVDGATWVLLAFSFGADECGTAIGFDRKAVLRARKHVWQVILYVKEGVFRLNTHKVQGSDVTDERLSVHEAMFGPQG